MNGLDISSTISNKQMLLHFFFKYNYINNFEFPKILKIELNIFIKNIVKKDILGKIFFLIKTFKQKPFFKLLKKKTVKSKYYIKDLKMLLINANFDYFFTFFLNSLSFLKKDFKILKLPKNNFKKGMSSFFLKKIPYNSFNNQYNIQSLINIKSKIYTNTSDLSILEEMYNSNLIPLKIS